MRRLAVLGVLVLCLVNGGVALAVDDDPPGICDGSVEHPAAVALDQRYDEATYDAIIGWFCKGYGMGEIRLALRLAAADGAEGPGWETLLATKADGVGWGDIMIALRICRTTGEDFAAVLSMRQEGAGWGEIRRELGLIGRARTGAGETEPDAEIDREPGPPAHAGPKWRAGEGLPGPPPHAGPKDKA